ncbi:MAG TPA: hypothetical protein VK129_03515 [Terriglobales bacterium]|nr:hypothetical protein [Terriglobales bacterium]
MVKKQVFGCASPAMESLIAKIAFLVACAIGLFIIMNFLSRVSENNVIAPPHIPDQLQPLLKTVPQPLPKVGRELRFPFDIRELEDELEAKYGPDFFRPKILNYYFQHTNLETGPADPTDFYDEFSVELENPADGHRWTSSYWVTTPAGLTHQMNENHEDTIWGHGTLVVKRFDLATILRSVLEGYAEAHAAEKNQESDSTQNLWNEDSG